MKVFTVKYLTVLAILAFGFLGGVIFVKRDHVGEDVLVQCQEEYLKLIEETNECKDKFVQCVMILIQERGVKK